MQLPLALHVDFRGNMVGAWTRVALDPESAVLEPGEVLVAPSTDPGWMPLFLTAGGLVIEMDGQKGAAGHGAVLPSSL